MIFSRDMQWQFLEEELKAEVKEFDDKLHVSMFGAIEKRVKFLEYNRVVDMYEGLTKVSNATW